MSCSFKDGEGRQWTVRVDVQAMRDVRAGLGLNLFTLVDHGFRGLGELLGDPMRFIDVLYLLCRQQCEERTVSDEAFGRLFMGDVLEAASEAFMEAFIGFFPNPQTRGSLRKLNQKSKETATLATARLEKEILAVDPAKVVESAFAQTTSRLFALNAPESSVSTPDPGRSAT